MAHQDDAFDLLGVAEIARLLRLHPRTVQLFLQQGRLRGMKIGRSWYTYRADLLEFIAQQRAAAIATAAEESRRN